MPLPVKLLVQLSFLELELRGGEGVPGVLSKIVDLGGPKQRQHSSLWVPIIKMES